MTYTQNTLDNYLNVQIVVNNLNDKYYFPDLPQLREAKITGISFYPKLSTTTNLDVNNVPLLNITNAIKSFLTLYSGDVQKVQNLPLMKLKNLWIQETNGGGAPENFNNNKVGNQEGIFQLNNLIIDFSKSYVSLASNQTITQTLPVSINFGVYYTL
jgi:hypothetical protein